MRRLLLALLLFSGATLASPVTGADPPARAGLSYPAVANAAWKRGERLTFRVQFGPLQAGTAVMTVEDEIVWSGRPTYRIRFSVSSAEWFFYSVRDSIITYMDKSGLFTYRYEKHQREGTYRNDEVTTFNHASTTADRVEDGERKPTFEFPRFAKDVLGSLYYLRTQTFDVGDVIRVPVSDGRKNYEMEIRVVSRQKVRTPAGEYMTLMIEPKLESEGIFVRRGRLFVWMTDDARHIPVRVKTMVPVGEVVANLESMRGVM